MPTHDNLWLVVRDVLVAATGRRDFQDVVDLNDAVVRVANILVWQVVGKTGYPTNLDFVAHAFPLTARGRISERSQRVAG